MTDTVPQLVLRIVALGALGAALAGCLERTITVTSSPPGAIVCLNDAEIGRTPVTTAFTFYGDYDVRLRREGYEPIIAHRKARAPFYEWPPADLVATALPMRIKTERHWDFELTPTRPMDPAGEADLLARARELRGRAEP